MKRRRAKICQASDIAKIFFQAAYKSTAHQLVLSAGHLWHLDRPFLWQQILGRLLFFLTIKTTILYQIQLWLNYYTLCSFDNSLRGLQMYLSVNYDWRTSIFFFHRFSIKLENSFKIGRMIIKIKEERLQSSSNASKKMTLPARL